MIENFDSRLLFSSFTNYAVPLFKESNNVTERDHFKACLNRKKTFLLIFFVFF